VPKASPSVASPGRTSAPTPGAPRERSKPARSTWAAAEILSLPFPDAPPSAALLLLLGPVCHWQTGLPGTGTRWQRRRSPLGFWKPPRQDEGGTRSAGGAEGARVRRSGIRERKRSSSHGRSMDRPLKAHVQ
jgi:hypothetical protein